jgi:UDP-N-acetylglucosamine 2-epimerase (non-hydrolysing)
MKKIVTVVGARPNFMKVAPIVSAIKDHKSMEHILVHTGQHYDQRMSDAFFSDLGLPSPDISLGVGSGSHAVQTADIMKKFEQVVEAQKPDLIIVVGDVNSTVACALAASKVVYDSSGARPRIAHVESGLRSFDRSMPEEINRKLTDHLSDLLFVTEESGLRNLRQEGISEEKIHFVGNTMIDTLLAFEKKADESTILRRLDLSGGENRPGSGTNKGEGHSTSGHRQAEASLPFALITLHRPSNVDKPESLKSILRALDEFKTELDFVFPVHPRTKKRMEEFGLMSRVVSTSYGSLIQSGDVSGATKGMRLTDPLGYLDFVCLMKHAKIVLTDSGGIQEETTCLGVPCVTLRENTERPVTLTNGTNVLAGLSEADIIKAIQLQLSRKPERKMPSLWDGRAAERILDVIVEKIGVDRAS